MPSLDDVAFGLAVVVAAVLLLTLVAMVPVSVYLTHKHEERKLDIMEDAVENGVRIDLELLERAAE